MCFVLLSSDPDATYTSFSNPNYFLDRALQQQRDNNNDSAAVNGNTGDNNSDYSSCGPTPTSPDRAMVLNKLNFAPGDSDNDGDEFEASHDARDRYANANDEAGDSDDDNCVEEDADFVRAPLVGPYKPRECEDDEESSGSTGSSIDADGGKTSRRTNRDEPARVYFGVGSRSAKRSRGILGYLEMLEQQALGRAATSVEQGKGGSAAHAGDRTDGQDDDEHAEPEVMQGGDQPVEEPNALEKWVIPLFA